MSGKVMPFPVLPPVADEADVLWLVAVASTLKDEYSCEYRSREHRWRVHVQSSTFAGAAALVEQCRHTMGWEQSMIREG